MPRTSVITREDLYELVWSVPMIKVAEKFDVSGNYLARVCTALRVPRPERGYWAKLAVGKAPKRPALPEPQPGDPIVWSRTDEFPSPSVPKPRPTPRPRAPRLTRHVTGTHGLIRGAKEHFLASRKVDEGEHLKPYKKLLSRIHAPEVKITGGRCLAKIAGGLRIRMGNNSDSGAPHGRPVRRLGQGVTPVRRNAPRGHRLRGFRRCGSDGAEAGWFAESQLRHLLPGRQQHRKDQEFAGMVPGCMPPLAGRWPVTAAQKKQRPLIRYAGSAAETSIGSKPIGSELNAEAYPKRHFCQAGLAMAQSWAYLPDLGQRHGRYARAAQINQRLVSTTSGSTGSIAAQPNPQP